MMIIYSDIYGADVTDQYIRPSADDFAYKDSLKIAV